MQWGNPQALYGLVLVIPLGVLVYSLKSWREKRLNRVIDQHVLATLMPPKRGSRDMTRLGLWLAAMALGLLALARPQWGEKWIEVRHMGLDILVVLDTSNSMRAEDIRPNRLERAKLGIRDLVRQLRGDRIGLIPFAGDSYLYCPLTTDYAAFLMMLDDVNPGLIPRGGTAIEQALRQAIQTFDNSLSADRVILLVTDGEDHEGNPLSVLDDLRRHNIRLFAVGVGTPEGDLIPMTDDAGRIEFLRDREGNLVRTALREDILERLATRSGGMYVRATPGDFGLEQIYDQGIAPLQRDMLDTEMIRTFEDRFVWFLGLALLLLVLEAVLGDGSGRLLRRAAGGVSVVFLLSNGISPVSADTPRASMQRGLREYQDQRFAEAADAFRQAAEEAADTRLDPARAHFNHANALFQQGRYEDAAHAYQDALRSTDLTLQQTAHFNRGNALLSMAEHLAGEQQYDTAKTFAEHALDSYRNALTLEPRDHDAKVNYELADRLREELEVLLEQQPPPAQQADPDDDQDPEDDDPAQPQPDEPAAQPQPDHDDPSDADSPSGDEDLHDGQNATEPSPRPESMDEMTEEEARILLDALRDEEQKTRDQMRPQLGEPESVEKDW